MDVKRGRKQVKKTSERVATRDRLVKDSSHTPFSARAGTQTQGTVSHSHGDDSGCSEKSK